jgi:hypothetical protein
VIIANKKKTPVYKIESDSDAISLGSSSDGENSSNVALVIADASTKAAALKKKTTPQQASSSSSSVSKKKTPPTPKTTSSSVAVVETPPINDSFEVILPPWLGSISNGCTVMVQMDPQDAATLDFEGVAGAIGRFEADDRGGMYTGPTLTLIPNHAEMVPSLTDATHSG